MNGVSAIISSIQEIYEYIDIYYGAIVYDELDENVFLIHDELKRHDFPVTLFPNGPFGRLFMIPKKHFKTFMKTEYYTDLTLVMTLTDANYEWFIETMRAQSKIEFKERMYIIKI